MDYSASIRMAQQRQEAREVTEGGDGAKAGPDYAKASYLDQQARRDFVRTVYGGTRTMRKSREILPPNPAESQQADAKGETYKRRVARSTAFNALARTGDALTGIIFRKDPTFGDDVPPELLADAEDIDRQGNALPVFAKDVALDALIDGHCFIHVETPNMQALERDGVVRNRRDANRVGARPYWLKITADRVINWRYEMRNGAPYTTLLVYTEAATEDEGEYGEQDVTRYRVLRPGSFEVWRHGEQAWIKEEEGTVALDYVPVVPVYAKRTGIFESAPPLEDLAYEQTDHFQVRSDYRTAMAFSAISVLAVIGADPKNVKWGANFMLTLSDPGADAKMLESAGNGLAHMRQELKDTEERMAALGLEMLVRKDGGQRTAREVGIKNAESTSALATFAVGIEDALNQALQIHADFRNKESGGTVTVNRDFDAHTIDPQTFRELREAAATGQISLFTLWERMVQGELLPDTFDAEEELQRLAEQSAVLLDAESAVLEQVRPAA